jgi:hypothetical protein
MSLDLIGPMMSAMLSHAASSLSPPVERAVLAPGGAVAWDDCCDGQVWVRLISIGPATGRRTSSFTAILPCGVTLWTVEVGIGVLRCAATLDDSGHAPSPAALTADTLQMTQDQANLSMAIQCEMTQLQEVEKLSPVSWLPLGPDGGCVGGEWRVTVLVDNCRCGSIDQVSGMVGVTSGG